VMGIDSVDHLKPDDGADPAHDVVAVGCGPFNLGLAALASTVPFLDLVAFDARPELRWHPGLMFDDAKLQLSFLADLVTLVAPTHPLSFLAYLQDVDRMYAFYIREEFHPTRREFEDYLRWALRKLPGVRFSHRIETVRWDQKTARFVLSIERSDGTRSRVRARDLVVGIGSEPSTPAALSGLPATHLLHSSDYLHRIADITRARRVTVVGSGQSGAEVVLDLLRRNAGRAAPSWLTRTPAFAPLDYTKLVLEMTTPAYVRYFYGLPQDVKDRLVGEQWQHYKGISSETLTQIHDLLYQRELDPDRAPVEFRCGVAVESAAVDRTGQVVLSCRHRDTGASFEHRTDLVVAATGYRERTPMFFAPLEPVLRRDDRGRYRVRADYSIELIESVGGRIFVANADLHSHGVAAPDLGMCAYRNATIINAIAGRELYRLPQRTAFTSFGAPTAAKPAVTPASPALRARRAASEQRPLGAALDWPEPRST
jgi:lysine N6-hydroxylase